MSKVDRNRPVRLPPSISILTSTLHFPLPLIVMFNESGITGASDEIRYMLVEALQSNNILNDCANKIQLSLSSSRCERYYCLRMCAQKIWFLRTVICCGCSILSSRVSCSSTQNTTICWEMFDNIRSFSELDGAAIFSLFNWIEH